VDSTPAKIAGAAAGVIATMVTARDAISRAFFKTMNKGRNGAFYDLQKTRDEAIGEITAPAKRGEFVPDAMDRVQKVIEKYDAEYIKRRKLLNIKGIGDEMKAIKQHQWWEIVFATGAVATLAVGAIITIASNRDAIRKTDTLEEEAEELSGRGR